MDQHPIPQQISSYEFKLVGEMTLKQFLKAAAGIVLALIINSTKLIFIIKWPLIILFAAGGLALAFVPFQDRPLEQWLVAFIKSIYSPTIFIYRRGKVQNWLDLDLTKKVEDESEGEFDDYDVPAPVYQKDNHRLKQFLTGLPTHRQGQVVGGSAEEYETVKKNEEEEPVEIEEVTVQEPIEEPKIIINPPTKNMTTIDEEWRNQKANLDLKTEKLEATGQAVFGSTPMPNMSMTIPNVIAGMITDKTGKLLEGAIVEIQDENGNPARVLKTNPLGQFKTSTPLTNGKYLIVIEKEGLLFDRINVILEGKVLQPLKIVPNN